MPAERLSEGVAIAVGGGGVENGRSSLLRIIGVTVLDPNV